MTVFVTSESKSLSIHPSPSYLTGSLKCDWTFLSATSTGKPVTSMLLTRCLDHTYTHPCSAPRLAGPPWFSVPTLHICQSKQKWLNLQKRYYNKITRNASLTLTLVHWTDCGACWRIHRLTSCSVLSSTWGTAQHPQSSEPKNACPRGTGAPPRDCWHTQIQQTMWKHCYFSSPTLFTAANYMNHRCSGQTCVKRSSSKYNYKYKSDNLCDLH